MTLKKWQDKVKSSSSPLYGADRCGHIASIFYLHEIASTHVDLYT